MKLTLILILLILFTDCRSRQKDNKKLNEISHSSESTPLNRSLLPEFKMLLVDSSTYLNSHKIPNGTATIFIYFSPYCSHCQKTIKDILASIDSLKATNIYLLTPLPFKALKEFTAQNNLQQYKNVMAGKDYQLSFYKLYKPKAIPYIAIYDREKRLVNICTGEETASSIIRLVTN